ncbi:MAG TPA: MFS transporter [Thermoanaerobaculia bacterium]
METAGRLLNRNFLLLWLGQSVSQLGNQAFNIAVAFWVVEKTGSATVMGLLMTVATLPGVLLGPIGGTFADRHPRVRILIVCDLLAAAGVLGLAAALFLVPDRVGLLVALLFVVEALEGVIRAFFMPAVSACIPDLAPEDKLEAANSLNQFSIQAFLLIGQTVGGVLYRVLGAPLLFFIDGLSFLFAAASAAFIRLPGTRRQPAPTEELGTGPFRRFLAETAEGFRYVWARKGMRDFMLTCSLVNFLLMPVVVLLPFYVQLYLKKGAAWYGFLMAALSAGTVAGFLLAGTLRPRGRARAAGIILSLLILPLVIGTLGFLRSPAAALAGSFLGGAALGFINVQLAVTTQSSTPAELRGRVMGLLGTLSGGLVPLGMALGGFLGDLTGKDVPLVYGVCAVLAVLVIVITTSGRESREYLAQD